jgi:hypothetical protein
VSKSHINEGGYMKQTRKEKRAPIDVIYFEAAVIGEYERELWKLIDALELVGLDLLAEKLKDIAKAFSNSSVELQMAARKLKETQCTSC